MGIDGLATAKDNTMPASALSCDACNKSFRVISNQAGRNVRCPHCSVVIFVPTSLFEAPSDTPVSVPVPSFPTPDVAPDVDPAASAHDDKPDSLDDIAKAVRESDRHRSRRAAPTSRVIFTHSMLGKRVNVLGNLVLAVATLVEVYMLVTLEWNLIAGLPFRVALPAFALAHLPASIVAITGVLLLVAAHQTEYLARIDASMES